MSKLLQQLKLTKLYKVFIRIHDSYSECSSHYIQFKIYINAISEEDAIKKAKDKLDINIIIDNFYFLRKNRNSLHKNCAKYIKYNIHENISKYEPNSRDNLIKIEDIDKIEFSKIEDIDKDDLNKIEDINIKYFTEIKNIIEEDSIIKLINISKKELLKNNISNNLLDNNLDYSLHNNFKEIKNYITSQLLCEEIFLDKTLVRYCDIHSFDVNEYIDY